MKHYRLWATSSIFFLLLFLSGCVKQSVMIQESADTPPVKKVEKSLPEIQVKHPKVTPPILSPPSGLINRHIIGCVSPLTGRFADAGSKALDAVMLSAGIFNQRPSPWKIVVADSGDSPEKIAEAVAYLADQEKVMAIVAIAGTADATAAAREAQKHQVPLILIAPKEGITETGEYVFQHFLTPTQQIEALTKYARNELNVGIFAVLYPQDDYGEEMVRHFRGEVQKTGGRVISAIPYNKTQTDFTEQIRKLTGNRIEASEKVYATNEEARNRLPVDFEALFIPDSAFRVKMIAAQLAFYDIKGLPLLGTSLWHSSDLLNKDTGYIEGAVFTDSFFVKGFLPETNDFVDVYYASYGREPGNIEALSYDTMELILSVLEDGQIKTRADFVKALPAVKGFRGATGDISFDGTRVARKNAFILRIQNGTLQQVK